MYPRCGKVNDSRGGQGECHRAKANVVITLLSFGGPYVGHRLAFVAASEFRERANNMGVLGNKMRGLHEDTESHAKFR